MAFVLRDFKLPMVANPDGFPAPATDFDVDEQNIRNVILTTPGERRRRPLFGSRIKSLLQQHISTRLFIMVTAEVRRAIRIHLPRIYVYGVDFSVVGPNRFLFLVDWDRVENVTAASSVFRTSISLEGGG